VFFGGEPGDLRPEKPGKKELGDGAICPKSWGEGD